MSDYKASLNLPATDFPMKANLANREGGFLKDWQDLDLYQQIRKKFKGKPYTRIIFKPDLKRFSLQLIPKDMIKIFKKRTIDMAGITPINVCFNNEGIKHPILAGLAMGLLIQIYEAGGRDLFLPEPICFCGISIKDKHRPDNIHTDNEKDDNLFLWPTLCVGVSPAIILLRICRRPARPGRARCAGRRQMRALIIK